MTVTDPRGYITTTAYNADNEPTLVTDPDGNAALTCYGDGNAAQTVPPAGVAANSLTPASCPTAYPAGYQNSARLASDATASTFNALGGQTQQTTPVPAGQTGYETTTYAYDADGQLLTITAPPASGSTQQVTSNTYNSAGELASQTTGSGTSAASTTTYCYNPNGDTTAVVAPDGNTSAVASCETSSPWVVSSSSYPTQAAYQTTSSYDSADELVSTTTPATTAAPSGATTSYTYDAEGNRLTSTDPDNITMTWTYTPDDHPASLSFSGTSAHSVTYGYDAEDDLTSMTDATGSSSYIYDPFSELTSATNGANQTVSYGYNADGKLTGITYPLPGTATWAATSTVAYGYDHADNLTSVTDFNNHQISITPNADSLPSSETLGSTGDTISYTYDPADTPSAVTLKNSSSTLQSFTYSEAPAGNILSETDTPSSSHTPAAYTYDAAGRVTSMTPGTGSTLNYGFDASSNLTTLPTGATATYDHAGELTSSVLSGTTTSYTYDADGHQLNSKQGSTTITSSTWNGADELTSYSDSAATMSAASYDGNGLRASATTGSGTQNFTWDQAGNLLMESTNAYIYTSSNAAPAEQVSLATGTITYLNTDSLGSVRGIISSAGALTATTYYDAWGNPQTTGGLTAYTPFGFAGAYTDPDGLLYLINRYYNPATGQFLSVDPDVATTGEPYGYAAGNPVDKTDPTGTRPKGIGYSFLIGRGFTWRQGEQFVADLCFGFCAQQYGFTTRLGDRRVDVYSYPGWINEVKTGYQSGRTFIYNQIAKDDILLNQGYGMHSGTKNPIGGGTWWFLPSEITKLSGSNVYTRLFNDGINVMLFIYRKGQNDNAYEDQYNWQCLTEAGNTHTRHPGVYDHLPVNPECPALPEFVV